MFRIPVFSMIVLAGFSMPVLAEDSYGRIARIIQESAETNHYLIDGDRFDRIESGSVFWSHHAQDRRFIYSDQFSDGFAHRFSRYPACVLPQKGYGKLYSGCGG